MTLIVWLGMRIWDCHLWVVEAVAIVYRNSCIKFRDEVPQKENPLANTDNCHPFSFLLIPRDAPESGCVIASNWSVGYVHPASDSAKILRCIVQFVAVNVVNLQTVGNRAVVVFVDNAMKKFTTNFCVPASIPKFKIPPMRRKLGSGEIVVKNNRKSYYGPLAISPACEREVERQRCNRRFGDSHDSLSRKDRGLWSGADGRLQLLSAPLYFYPAVHQLQDQSRGT